MNINARRGRCTARQKMTLLERGYAMQSGWEHFQIEEDLGLYGMIGSINTTRLESKIGSCSGMGSRPYG